MNKTETWGSITKIFSRSSEVFIFTFRSRDKYPLQIKVKKFRPKAMPPEVFTAQCDAFAEGDEVLIFGRIGSEKQSNAKGEVVKTTEGREVYGPILNAFAVLQISAAIVDEVPEGAAPANGLAAAPAPAPVSASHSSSGNGAQSTSNSAGFSMIGGPDDDTGLPISPFHQ